MDKIRSKNPLVSVIFFAENLPVNIVEQSLKSILSQFYKNKEIIIFYDSNRSDFDEVITTYSPYNCKFIPATPGLETCKQIKTHVNGEIIFYKTCNPTDWYPRHIEVHLEQYAHNRLSWVQSCIEFKDVARRDAPINTINWRIEPPKKVEEIEFDDISHDAKLNINWDTILGDNGLNKINFFKQLGNGSITNEISVIRWLNNVAAIKNNIAQQLGAPIEPKEPLAENHFNTILGNITQVNRNRDIWDKINSIDPLTITSIAIKRTIGMGDVIITEPIRRYLKGKFPNANITLMTSRTRGADAIAKYLGYDNLVFITEAEITQDALMKIIEEETVVEKPETGDIDIVMKTVYDYKDYQIKIDLDMAYECRLARPYLYAYFDVINVDFNQISQEEKEYKIYYNPPAEIIPEAKSIYVCRDGSGWPGKTWPDEHFNELTAWLIGNEYSITEHKMEPSIEEVLNKLLQHGFYLGTDSGVMHIALALGLKAMVICGAALTELTALPYLEVGKALSIHADNQQLPCLGCKHRDFFNIMQNNSITFVAPCTNSAGNVCMTGIRPEMIHQIILDFINDKIKDRTKVEAEEAA